MTILHGLSFHGRWQAFPNFGSLPYPGKALERENININIYFVWFWKNKFTVRLQELKYDFFAKKMNLYKSPWAI